MPFEEKFWRKLTVRDVDASWSAKQNAPETAPIGVKGFIVSLPINWTFGENNISGMNLMIIANNSLMQAPDAFATNDGVLEGEDSLLALN